MSHKCHAYRCSDLVAENRFMCLKHWLSLTTALRKSLAIYSKAKEPTPAYTEVAKKAVKHAAAREGVRLKGHEPELVACDKLYRSPYGT